MSDTSLGVLQVKRITYQEEELDVDMQSDRDAPKFDRKFAKLLNRQYREVSEQDNENSRTVGKYERRGFKRLRVAIMEVHKLQLQEFQVSIPQTYREFEKTDQKAFWIAAMEDELASYLKNDVMSLEKRDKIDPNITVVDTRWVFATKSDEDGYINRFKGRLVARGFTQIADKDYDDIYAPVIGSEQLRVLLGFSVIHRAKMMTFDVKTAFLNAPIDKDLYIKLPKESNDTYKDGVPKIYRVKKAIYGLKQSPVLWYEMYATFLTDELGYERLQSCQNIFHRGMDENYIVFAIYVDDSLIMCRNETVLKPLRRFEPDLLQMSRPLSRSSLGLPLTN